MNATIRENKVVKMHYTYLHASGHAALELDKLEILLQG